MKNNPMQFVNGVARRKLGLGEEWDAVAWEVAGKRGTSSDGFRVTLAEVVGVYTRGPKAGQPVWERGNDKKVVVTRAEEGKERHEWETETGLCGRCFGDGKTIWSSKLTEDGIERTFRDCPDCTGTGKATMKAPAEQPAKPEQREMFG